MLIDTIKNSHALSNIMAILHQEILKVDLSANNFLFIVPVVLLLPGWQ